MAKKSSHSDLIENMAENTPFISKKEIAPEHDDIKKETEQSQTEAKVIETKDKDATLLTEMGLDTSGFEKNTKKVIYVSEENHKKLIALSNLSNSSIIDLGNAIMSQFLTKNEGLIKKHLRKQVNDVWN